MWGWKTADRTITPAVPFEEAKQIVQDGGFELTTSNVKHAIFKRSGKTSGWTQFNPRGDDLPLEMALAESDQGLFMQLRYDEFVLFDTGDLNELADLIATALTQKS